ncbi:MAG: DUF1840 domain-containing protein [Oxalobacteraceae bacterium]|nr:DUF1840 domain-containing protein [Oxalobacteraceae bacterium]
MLITFKSKAAAEVVMYKEHAKPILDLLHKDVERGVITAAETASAIAKLEAEIAASRLPPTPEQVQHDVAAQDGAAGDDDEPVEIVAFASRAYPLLEMLRAAHRDGRDVVWGV